MLAYWQPDGAVTQCTVWCQIRRGVSLCLSCPHVNAETEFVKISTLEGVFQKLFTQMWTINWDLQGAGVIYFSHTNHIWPKFFNLSKFCHFFTLSFKLTAVVFCSIFSAILLLTWIYSDITWNHLSQATIWLCILIESAIKKQTDFFLKFRLKGQFSPSKTIKAAVDVA